MEFCIQNIIDIFSIIYSTERLGVPTTLDDVFSRLLKKRILPGKVIKLAEEMKGMRNVLVHRYGEINDVLVFSFLKERKGDFQKISLAIEEYLQKQNNNKKNVFV